MVTAQTMIAVMSAGETMNMSVVDLVEQFQFTGEIDVVSYDRAQTTGQIANTRCSTGKDFIYIQAGDVGPLIVTPDSRIYQPKSKEWIRASEINNGNEILHVSGDYIPVTETHTIRDRNMGKIYTVTITPTQCYYANNILIHNNK